MYLGNPPLRGFYAERIVPADGLAGNPIYVTDGTLAFGYHGYAMRTKLAQYYTSNWAGISDAGWNARLERVNFALLDRFELNARKMLGPEQYGLQYGYDPIARARRYLSKINHDATSKRALPSSEANL